MRRLLAPLSPPPSPPEPSDEALLKNVDEALRELVGTERYRAATAVAETLLCGDQVASTLHADGIRALLHQLTRNRDPEMQANHLTELRVAAALATVPGRRIELERRANTTNERRVDFALDDGPSTSLVEVKNLNLPLIKRSIDPLAAAFRRELAGDVRETDLHLFYLFFRRPRADDLAGLVREIRRGWRDAERSGRNMHVFFAPADRPQIGALVSPARGRAGGRVAVVDHGQHLREQPGGRLRVAHGKHLSPPGPRERLEEMFVKDNILRRLQDAEKKFPLQTTDRRAVLFCPGPWAPASHLDRCVDEAVHFYLEGHALPDDLWSPYYPHWARRWTHAPLHNIDGIYAVRPAQDGTCGEHHVRGGDVTFSVRIVFERAAGLCERIFFGA